MTPTAPSISATSATPSLPAASPAPCLTTLTAPSSLMPIPCAGVDTPNPTPIIEPGESSVKPPPTASVFCHPSTASTTVAPPSAATDSPPPSPNSLKRDASALQEIHAPVSKKPCCRESNNAEELSTTLPSAEKSNSASLTGNYAISVPIDVDAPDSHLTTTSAIVLQPPPAPVSAPPVKMELDATVGSLEASSQDMYPPPV
ncbi:hypothetical protein C0991_012443, partial [Blastosporella zonata]